MAAPRFRKGAASLFAAAVLGGAGVAIALVVSGEAAAVDDQTIFCSEFVTNVEASNFYKKWATQNTGERDKWIAFRSGICASENPAVPASATAFGKALVASGKMALTIDVPPETTTTTEPPPPPPPPPVTTPGPIAGQGYSQVFRDDFTTLDLGNQNTWSNGIWYSDPLPAPAMIFAQDGKLNLVSFKGRAPHYPSVTTLHHAGVGGRSFKFGYFEASMKWEAVRGAWPAFWLLSTLDRYQQNAPDPPTAWTGEIDIFEGYNDDYYGPTAFTGTLHKNTGSRWGITDQTRGVPRAEVANMTTGFHTYALLWTPTEVAWYFDGVRLATVPPFESTPQDMFLILTMQQESFIGGPEMDAPEMTLEVDYVSVWQR